MEPVNKRARTPRWSSSSSANPPAPIAVPNLAALQTAAAHRAPSQDQNQQHTQEVTNAAGCAQEGRRDGGPAAEEIDSPAPELSTASSRTTESSSSSSSTRISGSGKISAGPASAVTTGSDIDVDLYSRQLYAIGVEAQKKMMSSRVVLVGFTALAAEIAKNLVLMGVQGVTLYDSGCVELGDLCSNFLLTESDIGRKRGQVCAQRLADLNNYVSVSFVDSSSETLESLLSNHQIVVATGCFLAVALKINKVCRAHGIKFVWADTRACFCFAFNDFGPGFAVSDRTGEQPHCYNVARITQDSCATVSVIEDQVVEFEEGSGAVFSGVEGMEEINFDPIRNSKSYVCKVTGLHEIQIGDTSSYHPYSSGGYISEVKKPSVMDFDSLEESLKSPRLIEVDSSRATRNAQLFSAFRGLWDWADSHDGTLPEYFDKRHASEVAEHARKYQLAGVEFNDDLSSTLSHICRGELPPLVTFLGGVVCQEVMKACSGKYSPINQWLLYDCDDVLPGGGDKPFELSPHCRYERQTMVLGKEVVHAILNAKMFLVGAGAIGCEVLKTWAMMGLGCGDNGIVHLTDMDLITKSNLSRQFLFRPSDIDKLKSEVAASAAVKMNASMKIKPYSSRVGIETESTFDEDFYSSLIGVCTALDNVAARLYMDSQCVLYGKALIDSGTLGTKGNTQVVVPLLTESYASSHDPPEKGIPLCTLHHFPNVIDHTIQWARDYFDGLFTKDPLVVQSYLTQASYLDNVGHQSLALKKETLETLKTLLVTQRTKNFVHCVKWARLQFNLMFTENIKNLLYNFPPDSLTNTGVPFWLAPKKCPAPLEFDVNDSTHRDFILAAANLRAFNFGIPSQSLTKGELSSIVTEVILPEWQPSGTIKLDNTETGESHTGQSEPTNSVDPDFDAVCTTLQSEIPQPSELKSLAVLPCEFEKDDDANFHMAFVTAASNLRAANYKIPPADFQRTKLIAGKIIPAMISTTAVVSGLQCIELIKVIAGVKSLAKYRNAFVNLALPFFAFSEPLAAPLTEVRKGWSWSIWEHIDISGLSNCTLLEFLNTMKDKFQLDVQMVSLGNAMLYSMFASNREKLGTKMTVLFDKILGPDPARKYVILGVSCTRLEDDLDVDIPPVFFYTQES
ncbi:ubiquitin activating enzyme E1 [Pelomyxa schiedti]|nr:ubiquitin activating enzyme E1 [Pelomyxa schiedti]